MNEAKPVPLANDPAREAVDSLRGYSYQILRSILPLPQCRLVAAHQNVDHVVERPASLRPDTSGGVRLQVLGVVLARCLDHGIPVKLRVLLERRGKGFDEHRAHLTFLLAVGVGDDSQHPFDLVFSVGAEQRRDCG
jgi:hypothetical protein